MTLTLTLRGRFRGGLVLQLSTFPNHQSCLFIMSNVNIMSRKTEGISIREIKWFKTLRALLYNKRIMKYHKYHELNIIVQPAYRVEVSSFLCLFRFSFTYCFSTRSPSENSLCKILAVQWHVMTTGYRDALGCLEFAAWSPCGWERLSSRTCGAEGGESHSPDMERQCGKEEALIKSSSIECH